MNFNLLVLFRLLVEILGFLCLACRRGGSDGGVRRGVGPLHRRLGERAHGIFQDMASYRVTQRLSRLGKAQSAGRSIGPLRAFSSDARIRPRLRSENPRALRIGQGLCVPLTRLLGFRG